LVFIAVLHKFLACSILQTARERGLFPGTKAVCGINFRETRAAHLDGPFHVTNIQTIPETYLFLLAPKNLPGNKSNGRLVLHINGTDNK
jgi:hypothetical protein